jgi:tRNA(Phe) wybutosine-synthesizing methylase Tyw3
MWVPVILGRLVYIWGLTGLLQVTSSSCSGRIAVFCGEAAVSNSAEVGSDLITKGGKWLIAEHATITFDQLAAALRSPDAHSNTSNMVRRGRLPCVGLVLYG